jgi:diketogulonate reductase-like aldo/keto reductase
MEVLRHPAMAKLAAQLQSTPAQVIFAFSRAVGMIPLTGTSNPEHMKQDLAGLNLVLPAEVVRQIEGLVG